jgi:hypothetical protein
MSRVRATLFAGDQVLSIGQADVSDTAHCLFWPDKLETLDRIPDQPISLTLHLGKDQTIPIVDLEKCDAPLLTLHWHFRIC